MKLSADTQNILKNFATINKSILVRPGDVLRTVSPSRTIFATATVLESFDKQVCIYDVNRFLGALSLLEDADIELDESFLTISDGKRKIRYVYADTRAIVAPPEKNATLPSEDITFSISMTEFQGLVKGAAVLSLPTIVVTRSGDDVTIGASDVNNPSSDVYSAAITNFQSDEDNFNVVFSLENLSKVLPRDYNVVVTKSGFARFEAKDVTYFVALEKSSRYGND